MGEKRRKEEGGRHKGLSYFLCHLLARTFAAFPLHHVKDCKQANNNSTSETTEREQHIVLLWRSVDLQLRRKKTFVFTVHLNNIYLFVKRKGLLEDLCEPLSMAWLSNYGTCHSQDAELPSLLFMTRHPIMAYHSLNGIQLFTSEYRPVSFFFQIEAMSLVNM